MSNKTENFRKCLDGNVESYKDQYEEYLRDCLSYTGQYESLRRLGVKIFGAEQIAMLSDYHLADEIQKYYAVVNHSDEDIVLVERARLEEYYKLIKVISR